MVYFDQNLISLGLNVSSADEAIASLGKLLHMGGYVEDTFIENVIKREQEFATGLPLVGGINVAIPHTDSEHVKIPAIAVGVLANPVEFYVMGSPNNKTQVSLVFLLAIDEPDRQIEVLKSLVEFLQNPEMIKKITEAERAEVIVELLSKQFNHSEIER